MKDLVDEAVLDGILARVMEISGERNEVVHGVWGDPAAVIGWRPPWPPEDDVHNSMLKKSGRRFHQSSWTTAKMHDLAARIAQIRFDLNHLLSPLPWPIGRDFSTLPPEKGS